MIKGTDLLKSNSDVYSNVVTLLFNARTNAHIMHLNTDSYAQHMALDGFYKDIFEIAATFAESSIGTRGSKLTGIQLGELSNKAPVDFLTEVLDKLTMLRSKLNTVREGHLIQLMDDAAELFTTTIYKLKQLK